MLFGFIIFVTLKDTGDFLRRWCQRGQGFEDCLAFQGTARCQSRPWLPNPRLLMRVLILVENLPVPFDRRVWQEACALRDAGHQVTVICPQMRGYTQPEEVLDGIQIYRHWISGEAKSLTGFVSEYASALVGRVHLRAQSVATRRIRRDSSLQSTRPALPRRAAVQALRRRESHLRRA
jgi:hypothetical protein